MSRPSSWWIGVSLLLLSDSIWTTECFTASPSIRMTQPWIRPTTKTTSWSSSPTFLPPLRAVSDDDDDGNDNKKEKSAILTRLNGWLRNSKISKLTASKGDLAATPQTPVRRILSTLARVKDLHNPITYLLIATYFAIRVKWLIQNPYFLFAVGFCIKWYRARYVFKIPVWDRQPNWNNIITSREQEKDLKAYTCKKCGSTIFIAKTREFFFEGNTGIGGLGCFTCGAKGKENFIMDRDRIVEDVKELDDYFEYERPLDFVSRAERRKLLQETKGDEERANQLLIERANAVAGTGTTTATIETTAVETNEADSVLAENGNIELEEEVEAATPELRGSAVDEQAEEEEVGDEEGSSSTSGTSYVTPPSPPLSTTISSKKSEDLDILDMDDF